MSIDPRHIVNLKGKEFVLYAGLLDAATAAGLRSLTARVLQVPSVENGGMAVVLARAEFADGRVFEDVGDASPANCSPQIAPAALRMASTRAKGRCLRDALNVGMATVEELPDEERSEPLRPAGNGNGASVCSAPGCEKALTPAQATVSGHTYGRALCPQHQKGATRRG